jgi:WD40 repeat protein
MNRAVRTTRHLVAVVCLLAFTAVAVLAESAKTDSPNAIRHTRRIPLSGSPNALAVSGDGKTIVAASGKVLTAIDAISGKALHRWEQSKDIVDISVSANGRLIAVTTGSPIVDVYDKETGERSQQLHRKDAHDFLRDDGQQRIAMYPDGSKLISMGKKVRIYVSDVETGDWDHIIFVKYDACTPIVSPDGKHVALFGMQKDRELSGQVTMYLVRRGLQPLWTKWHESKEAVTHAAFSPDGLRMASSGAGDGVRVWNVESGELIAHVESEPEARLLEASFVADGNHLLMVSPRALQLRRLDRDGVVASVAISEQDSLRGSACSHDGAVVVTFSSEAAVELWSVDRP